MILKFGSCRCLFQDPRGIFKDSLHSKLQRNTTNVLQKAEVRYRPHSFLHSTKQETDNLRDQFEMWPWARCWMFSYPQFVPLYQAYLRERRGWTKLGTHLAGLPQRTHRTNESYCYCCCSWIFVSIPGKLLEVEPGRMPPLSTFSVLWNQRPHAHHSYIRTDDGSVYRRPVPAM